MSYATARRVDFSEIPVIDLDRPPGAVGEDIRRAAIAVGFFYVANHGVARPVVDDAFAAARDFFRAPAAVKESVRVNALHRGWLKPGGATMDGAARPDLKESFIFGLDLPANDADVAAGTPLMGPNQWPAGVPALRPALSAYYDAILACGRRLMQGFAAALHLPPDHFQAAFRKPLARGTAIWYPPQPPGDADQFGVAPHTDYGCITILAQDATGGLQVKNRAGDWIAAPPIADTFVINIGDLMARWTNDYFASTVHRAINRSGRERYSIPFFYGIDSQQVVQVLPTCIGPDRPAKYPPITCGDYIRSRFDATYAHRQPETAV